MNLDQKAIVWFEEVGKGDVAIVGGKGANLGEMTRAQIPVPPGFIVTAKAYFDFVQQSDIAAQIESLLSGLDPQDSRRLQEVADKIKQIIMASPMPLELQNQIKEAYRKMGAGPVAVRSSATAEDLPEASFAGQQRTFLNVQGEKDVVTAVQGCWASLFEPRAIFYRVHQGFDHSEVGLAVPVQKMVQSETSGVMFTVEPVTSDPTKIVIEAVYGLGETIVSGEATPDLYILDKENLKVTTRKISKQEVKLVRNPDQSHNNKNLQLKVSAAEQARQKLPDQDIVELAKIGRRLEQHYKFPQDVEWAKQGGRLFIVQTRPVTTIKEPVGVEEEITAPVLLNGAPASPGVACGLVKIVKDPTEIYKVAKGDILVAEMTTPDYVPAMKRAVAIVTDRGGRTAHAAIVSRELGIPCVVGTGTATSLLKDTQTISVDGSRGKVYDGKVEVKADSNLALKEQIKTRTRVYVNLAQPELAEMIAARNVDGVGLLRAEFIVAQIGEHPQYMLSQNRREEFITKLAEGLETFARSFHPRPVVYRTNDFKTNEYRELKGGKDYESSEENPMLGYRGASRYIKEPEVFGMEIEAIKRVRNKYPNLWVMIPFVRTVNELQRTKDLMESFGLKRSENFKLWMMVEVPSNIFLLEKFLQVGIDGISIGSNDLTQLILGVDRDSEKLAETFDERNEAVLMALEKAIKVSGSMGVTSSICGQAPSVYPELTEKLVNWGITSVSVSPDMIGTTREIISRAEKKLKLDV